MLDESLLSELFTEGELAVVRTFSDEVQAELMDSEYANRQHYSRATYALGCHGPLCKLAETHRGRKRNEQRAREAGRDYKPNLDQREQDTDVELAPVVGWHLHYREGLHLRRADRRKWKDLKGTSDI